MLLKDFLKRVLLLEAACFQNTVIAGAIMSPPPKLRTLTHNIYTLYSAHILTIRIKQFFIYFVYMYHI